MRKALAFIGIITLLLLFNVSVYSETIGYQSLTNKIQNINITLYWYSLAKSGYEKVLFSTGKPITFQYYLNVNKNKLGYLLDYSNQTLISGVTVATGCYFDKKGGYLFCLKVLNSSDCVYDKTQHLFICNVTIPNTSSKTYPDEILINPFLGFKAETITYTGSTYYLDFSQYDGKIFNFSQIYIISGSLLPGSNFIKPSEISLTGELVYINDTESSFINKTLYTEKYTIKGLYVFKLSNTTNVTPKNVQWIVPNNSSLITRYEVLKKHGTIWYNVSNVSFLVFNNYAVLAKVYPVFNFTKSLEAYILKGNASISLNFGYMTVYAKLILTDSNIKVALPKTPVVYVFDNETTPPKLLYKGKPTLTCTSSYCLLILRIPIFSSDTLIDVPLNISYKGELDPPRIYFNVTNITYNLSFNLNTSKSIGLEIIPIKNNLNKNTIFLVPPLATDLFLFQPSEQLDEKVSSGTFTLKFSLTKYADLDSSADTINLSIQFTDPDVNINSFHVIDVATGSYLDSYCKSVLNHDATHKVSYLNISCKFPENEIKTGGQVQFSLTGTYSTSTVCLVTTVNVLGKTLSGEWQIKDQRIFNPCNCKIQILGIYPDWDNCPTCQNPDSYATGDPNVSDILGCLDHNISILIKSTCLAVLVKENATTTTSYPPFNLIFHNSTYEYNITVNFDTWSNLTNTKNIIVVGISNPNQLSTQLGTTLENFAKNDINISNTFKQLIGKYGSYKLFVVKVCNVTNVSLYSLKYVFANPAPSYGSNTYKINLPLNFTINKTRYCKNCCKNCTHYGNITYNFTLYHPRPLTIEDVYIYNCPTGATCSKKVSVINSNEYNITIYINDTEYPKFPRKKYNLTITFIVKGTIDYPEFNYSKKMKITLLDTNGVAKSFEIPVYMWNKTTYVVVKGQGVILPPNNIQTGWLNGNSNYFFIGIPFDVVSPGIVGKVVVSITPTVTINNVIATTPYKSLSYSGSTITITKWNVSLKNLPEIIANLSGVNPGMTLTIDVKIYAKTTSTTPKAEKKYTIEVPPKTGNKITVNVTPSPIIMDIKKVYKLFTVTESWHISGGKKMIVTCFFKNISNLPSDAIGLKWGIKTLALGSTIGQLKEQNNITRYKNIPFIGWVICFANVSGTSAINKTLVIYDPFNHTEQNCFGLEFKNDILNITNYGESINNKVYINLTLENKKTLNINSISFIKGSVYCSASTGKNYINFTCSQFPNISEGFYLEVKIKAIENSTYPYSNFTYSVSIPYLNFTDNYTKIKWPNCGPGILLTYLGQCKYAYDKFYSTLGAIRLFCRLWPWANSKSFSVKLSNEKTLTHTYGSCYDSVMAYFNGSISGICSCVKNTTPLYNGTLDVVCSPGACSSTCKNGSLCNFNAVDVMIMPSKQCLLVDSSGTTTAQIELCNLNNKTPIDLNSLKVNISYYKGYAVKTLPETTLDEGACENYTFTLTGLKYYPLFYKVKINSISSVDGTNFLEKDVYYLPACRDQCVATIKTNVNKITLCNAPTILKLNVTVKCNKFKNFEVYVGLIRYVDQGEIYIENITPYNCTTSSGKYCIFKFKISTPPGKNTIGWVMPVVYINKSAFINKQCLYNGNSIKDCKIPVLLGEIVNITFVNITTGKEKWCYCPGEPSNITLNITNYYKTDINANISIYSDNPPIFDTYVLNTLPSCKYIIQKFENVVLRYHGAPPAKLLITAKVKDTVNGKIVGENSTEIPICTNCIKCFSLIWSNRTPQILTCANWNGPKDGVYTYKYVILQFNISRRNVGTCPAFSPEFYLNDSIPGNKYAYAINISQCKLIAHNNITTSYVDYYNLTYRCPLQKVGKIYLPPGKIVKKPILVNVSIFPNKLDHLVKFFLKTLEDECNKTFNRTCYLRTKNDWLFDVLDIEQFFANNKLINNYVICAGNKAAPKNYSTHGCYAYSLSSNEWGKISSFVGSCAGSIATLSYDYYNGLQESYVKNIISKLGASAVLPWNQGSWSGIACQPSESGCLDEVVSGSKFPVIEAKDCCGSCSSGSGVCQYLNGKCTCLPYITTSSCIVAGVLVYCVAEKGSCSACSDLAVSGSELNKVKNICKKYLNILDSYPSSERSEILENWIRDVLPVADEKCNIYAVNLSSNKYGPGWICKTSYMYGKPSKDRAYKKGFKVGECVPAAIQFGKNCSDYGLKPGTEPVTNITIFHSICHTTLAGVGYINDKILDLICDFNRTNCLSGENWTAAVEVKILGVKTWTAFCAPSNPCAEPNEYEQIYIIAHISGKVYWCRMKDTEQGLSEMGNNCKVVVKYCLKGNISTKYCTFLKLLTPKKSVYINVIGSKVYVAGTVQLSKNIQEAFGFIYPNTTPQLRWILLKQVSKTPVVPEVPAPVYPVYLLIIAFGVVIINRRFRRNQED